MQGGFKAVESDCWALGNAVRKTFAEFGYTSVAADGFAAPGVVVVSHGFNILNLLQYQTQNPGPPPTNL